MDIRLILKLKQKLKKDQTIPDHLILLDEQQHVIPQKIIPSTTPNHDRLIA